LQAAESSACLVSMTESNSAGRAPPAAAAPSVSISMSPVPLEGAMPTEAWTLARALGRDRGLSEELLLIEYDVDSLSGSVTLFNETSYNPSGSILSVESIRKLLTRGIVLLLELERLEHERVPLVYNM
jgi:hypothetical protein